MRASRAEAIARGSKGQSVIGPSVPKVVVIDSDGEVDDRQAAGEHLGRDERGVRHAQHEAGGRRVVGLRELGGLEDAEGAVGEGRADRAGLAEQHDVDVGAAAVELLQREQAERHGAPRRDGAGVEEHHASRRRTGRGRYVSWSTPRSKWSARAP